MTKIIDRNELRRLAEKDAALVLEVLPRDEYESEHIAGAANVPLPALNAESVRSFERDRPVAVYCHDFT